MLPEPLGGGMESGNGRNAETVRVSDVRSFVKPAAGGTVDQNLREALRAVRAHLGLEIAFISEFAGGRRVFRHVESIGSRPPFAAGDSDPLEETFCQRVVDGRLPELIPETNALPGGWERQVAVAKGIRCHVSVPIRIEGGQVYGTLCCYGGASETGLNLRDLAIMRAFAVFAGSEIERGLREERARRETTDRLGGLFASGGMSTLLQPILDAEEGRIVGFEALTRFSAQPVRAPDLWFREAAAAGLGEKLEMLAAGSALELARRFPPGVYLGVNASAVHVLSGAIPRALESAPLERVVLEVTEHEPVDDYPAFAAAIAPLRERGVRLAIDDAGAGYSTFRHILGLAPDFIKLDMSLTRDVHRDRTRRALAGALTRFAADTGSRIVAEGVETDVELATLRQFGVGLFQGYLVGRPQPFEAALALLEKRIGG